MNTLTKKIISSSMLFSIAIAGVALTPTPAQANDGFRFGFGSKSNINMGLLDSNLESSLNIQDSLFVSAVKTAKITFKKAVVDANQEFKSDTKIARTKFVTAVRATEDATIRKAALKTYLTELLTAYKEKSASIQAAFEVFINTSFN